MTADWQLLADSIKAALLAAISHYQECVDLSARLRNEIPIAYKDVDAVMVAQSDLLEFVHILKQAVLRQPNGDNILLPMRNLPHTFYRLRYKQIKWECKCLFCSGAIFGIANWGCFRGLA
jgi:tRNA-splicing ligase RtcB